MRITMSLWVHIMHLNHSNSQCDLRMTWSSTIFENDVPGNTDVHPYQNLTHFYLHHRGEFNLASLPHDRTFYWVLLNFVSSLLRSHCLYLLQLQGEKNQRGQLLQPLLLQECRKKNIIFVCEAVCGLIHRLSCWEYQRKGKLSFDYWKQQKALRIYSKGYSFM